MLQFKKEDGVDRKQEQVNIDPDPDEEEMEDMSPDDKIERHWKTVIEENYGGVDDKKFIIHTKRWGVYMNDKKR